MLVDANILLFAVDAASSFHESAAAWLTDRLNGPVRVGLPWQSLEAFVRISTHPRATATPLAPEDAWSFVTDWLASDVVWTPVPTDDHADVLGRLIATYRIGGNLLPDASLAALAIEHGLTVVSADSDFARFREIRWENPIR
jgi:toxin-antitoxin system PIN domain toxin